MGLKLDNLSTNFDKRSNNLNEVHIDLVTLAIVRFLIKLMTNTTIVLPISNKISY